MTATATQRLVTWASRAIERRVSRRGFLARTTLVGTAVSAVGWDFIVRPGSAYAWVCGEGASCYSGWTAMCCSINGGINQCPPGSFAGGWWKAEGASLCGGSARYYVDCQAECVDCGCGGGHFCEEGCWSCRPHCADGGCDRRRVCHTVFRYGQCNRHRECSGPVMCRAISCTPPWEWAECSTAAATSQATVSHSAPCLPGWTAINERYTKLGSQGSILGATVGPEVTGAFGRMQRYVNGRMYSSAETGPHYLTGEVLRCYLALTESASPLRLPITDSHQLLGAGGDLVLGSTAAFERGDIYQRHGAPAFALWGAVDARYQSAGGPRGPLGFPTATVSPTSDGSGEFATFDNGAIYLQGGGHPYVLPGAIAAKYADLGAVDGPLGYPTSDATDATDAVGNEGSLVNFTNGVVAEANGAAYGVWGAIYAAWVEQGGAAGVLGFPVSDVTTEGELDQCTFEYGTVTVDDDTGEVTTTLDPGAPGSD